MLHTAKSETGGGGAGLHVGDGRGEKMSSSAEIGIWHVYENSKWKKPSKQF